MNIIHLAGRLGKDAEKRFTPKNQQVISFNVATNSRRSGNEETMWWRISCWGDQWERIFPYLKKGSSIVVTGEITKFDTYTDKEGRTQKSIDVRATDLQFNPFGGEKQNSESSNASPYAQKAAPAPADPYAGFGQQQSEGPFGSQGFHTHSPAMQGQGEYHNAIDPNEVPF